VGLAPLLEAAGVTGPIECAIYSPPSAGAVVQQLRAGFLSKLGSLDQKAVAKRWAAAIAPGQEWPKEPIPTRRIRDLVRAHDSGFAVWSTGHNGWLISSEGAGFLTVSVDRAALACWNCTLGDQERIQTVGSHGYLGDVGLDKTPA
jgi:hypothetical protein